MTAQELIDSFFSNPAYDVREYRLFARLFLRHLAEHTHELRLAAGERICDVSDVTAGLKELAEAALAEPRLAVKLTRRQEQPRWDRTCPDCDHEHEGRNACEKYLGEGKFCQCESKVHA